MTIRKFSFLSLRVFQAIALLMAFAFSLSARPVDVHSAKLVAEGFFQTQGASLRNGGNQALHLEAIALRTPNKNLTLLTTEDPLLRSGVSVAPASFYVFNRGDNGGYAIVAGDDLLAPIIGYSLTGQISLKDVPSYLLGFFEKVNLAIENALESGSPILLNEMRPLPAVKVQQSFANAISPLLGTIEWDQGYPWNKFCPEVKTNTGATVKAPVGCVATAMVQIMRYHQWPTRGESASAYTDKSSGASLSANYGQTTYDYSLMPKNLNSGQFTSAEEDEVAKISSHAGISVQMSYTAAGSGAYSFYVGDAYRRHFRYDKSTTILPRDAFSTEEWYGYVYTELNEGRPLYYAGAGSGGGHAFVFDGYDESGNVHVNWGWAGMSNGYFNMNLLNPSALGTGGGTGGGFNYGQECSINLKPDKDGSSVEPNGILYYDKFLVNVDTENKSIHLGAFQAFVYDHNHYNGSFAIAAESFDGGELIVGTSVESIPTVRFGYYYNKENLLETSFSSLKDGYYLIRPVYKSRNAKGEEEWVPFRYYKFLNRFSPIRHTLIKVSENGTKWERIEDADSMERTSISFNTNKSAGESFLFKANGIASAKQSGLENVPVLNGEEQQLVLKSDKVSIEGFYNNLTIQNAGITELFLNATSSLTKLDVRNNEIGYLNAGHMPNIDSLDISYNKVSVLTIDACEKLKYINVTGNRLNADDLAKIISKLPARPANDKGHLVVREVSDNPHANDVWGYAVDVQVAAGKNWWIMTYDPVQKTYGLYKGVATGTEGVAGDNAPQVYPIPATNKLYISGIASGTSIKLYSLAGELLSEQVAISGTNELAVAGLPRGQYILVAGDFKQTVLLGNAE